MPELVEQEVWLETAVKECQTSADFKSRRLANATGFLKHIRLSMETLIQCSAARPRDCKGRIQVDAQPIYKRFFNSNRIYQVPFWQSAQFLHCAALIRAAEADEIDTLTNPIRHLQADPVGAALSGSPFADKLVVKLVTSLSNKWDQTSSMWRQSCGMNASTPVPSPAFTNATQGRPGDSTKATPESGRKRKGLDRHVADYCAKLSKSNTDFTMVQTFDDWSTVAAFWTDWQVKLVLEQLHGRLWRGYDNGAKYFSLRKILGDAMQCMIDAGTDETAMLIHFQGRVDSLAPPPNPNGKVTKATVAGCFTSLINEIRIANSNAKKSGTEQ